MEASDLGQRKTAVVFDLWGTLVPFPRSGWDAALARMAAALGADLDQFLPAWHADYAERAVGDVELSLRRVCRLAGVTADDTRIQEVLAIRRAALAAMFVPRPDAAPTLHQLRARGYRTGLLTNCTSEIPRLWRDSPLSPLVDAAVFSCTDGLRKPDPAAYELAASRLGLEARHCVFIGDGADSELDGASAVGMHAILLRPGDTDPPDGWHGAAIQRLADIVTLVAGGPACRRASELTRQLRQAAAAQDPLTRREHEIAELVSAGLTNRAIADRLVLSERTVEGHVRNILAKLQLTNRTELTAWALRSGPAP